MSERLKLFVGSRWAFFLWGAMVAVIVVLGVRYVTYMPHETHYHANFAVYINGQREQFKDPQYYQEVKICSLHGSTPLARAHMHDNVGSVIHVHDDAVTWGQFFANLGWTLGPDFIRTLDTTYTADGTNKLNIVKNGDNLTGLTNITNEVIGDKDRLLISFGPSDQSVLDAQYKTVPNTAATYDARQDPASCSGAEALTPADRLKHLF